MSGVFKDMLSNRPDTFVSTLIAILATGLAVLFLPLLEISGGALVFAIAWGLSYATFKLVKWRQGKSKSERRR